VRIDCTNLLGKLLTVPGAALLLASVYVQFGLAHTVGRALDWLGVPPPAREPVEDSHARTWRGR